jgi:hypothetical protein
MKKFLLGFAMLVVCCCQTGNGQTCCSQQSFCSGYIRGCFCTSVHPDQPAQALACRLNTMQGA